MLRNRAAVAEAVADGERLGTSVASARIRGAIERVNDDIARLLRDGERVVAAIDFALA